MKWMILVGAMLLGSGLSGNAAAAMIKWDIDADLTSTSTNCSNGVGNSCTFNKGGEIIKASAYSTSNDSGTGVFKAASIALYDGGLGVKSAGQTNENSSPQHAIDNNGPDELVVFEFASSMFNPDTFMIGWKSGDADIRVWLGGEDLAAGYNFTGKGFSDLAGLGFTLFSFNNVATNTLKYFNTDLTAHYLIFAPQPYNANGGDANYDYFKLSQITGEYVSVTPAEVTTVPEPGTAALICVALAGLWISRRQQGMPSVQLSKSLFNTKLTSNRNKVATQAPQ